MFAIFATLCIVIGSIESVTKHPLVMVLSFDGFRSDYISEELTPNLFRLREISATPPYVRSVFPTTTFTNHFSMATGLYAEEHGVLGYQMFDENFEKTTDSYKMFHYDESVVPIWIQNENTGNERYSGVMMWSGSGYSYQNKKPTYYKAFNGSVNWTSRIDSCMSWITDKNRPANLVLAYIEEPDHAAHYNGFNTLAFKSQITNVDNTIKFLLDSIKAKKLENKLNLILLTDHGMTEIKYDKMVFLDDYVSNSTYTTVDIGVNVFIHPNPGKMDEVYNNLKKGSIMSKKFKVYKPEEIPDRWHIKKSPRLKDLILVSAEPNYGIWDENFRKQFDLMNPDKSNMGIHGYDNENPDMRGFFMASGPIFKKNFTAQPFDNINLYTLISHVMNLDKPASKVQPHGSLAAVEQLLQPGFKSTSG